jgi:hypothetical protein
MPKPLIQINDTVREMTDAEHTDWLNSQPQERATTKEQLLAELQVLTAKINALG